MPKSAFLAALTYQIVVGAVCADEPANIQPADFKPSPEQEAFFEQKVRPILVAQCLECHGEKKQEGGLRLDSRAAILKGNEAGPALVPGRTEDSRLVEVTEQEVTFSWKDYKSNCQHREMTLLGVEFVRRFCLHILPRGLVRIRQYGLLCNRDRGERLARCRELLGMAPQQAAGRLDRHTAPLQGHAPRRALFARGRRIRQGGHRESLR